MTKTISKPTSPAVQSRTDAVVVRATGQAGVNRWACGYEGVLKLDYNDNTKTLKL